MSSVVYYRFKSSKVSQRINFDGTGISIFDLKREIVLANGLENTADSFDLRLVNPDNGEIYSDDAEVLPRSSSVEVRRVPTSRPGARDSASRYVSGSLVGNAKNASRRENFKRTASEVETPAAPVVIPTSGSEEDKVNAMFAAQGAQWSQTQQEMATKTPIFNPRAAANIPEKPLPPHYICHRCGQRGHWIQNCPSLTDPNWEIKKVRRTTGIPRSMLRTVDKPPDDGKTYLMTPDGEYVVAVADDKSWQDFQRRQQQQQARAQREVPEELMDPITHELMVAPHSMPCCGKTYSEASIQESLIASDFHCPNCGREDIFIDQLVPDTDMMAKIDRFENPDIASPKEVKEEPNGVHSPPKTESNDLPESDDSDYEPTADSPRSHISIGSPREEMEQDEQNNQQQQQASQQPPQAAQFFPMMWPFMMPMPPPGRSIKPYEQPVAKDDSSPMDESSSSSDSDEDSSRMLRKRRK